MHILLDKHSLYKAKKLQPFSWSFFKKYILFYFLTAFTIAKAALTSFSNFA